MVEEEKLAELCKNSEDKTKCKIELKNILKGISKITGLTSEDLIAIMKEPDIEEPETQEIKESEPPETEPAPEEPEEPQIEEETE